MRPQVSVLISVHNGAFTLAESMESLTRQTFESFEVVAIDDGSTDTTAHILQAFAAKDSRIRVLRNERNLGLARSLNRALREARGTFVARQDADDASFPNRLERQVEFLASHPQVGLVGTSCILVDSKGRTHEVTPVALTHDAIAWTLLFQNCLIHSSILARRDLLIAAGGYDPRFRYGQDYEFWTRLAGRTKVAQLEDPLIKLRAAPFGGAKFEETGETVRYVFRRSLMGLLGRPATEDEVDGLLRLGRGQSVQHGAGVLRVAALVVKMHGRFLSETNPPPADRNTIRKDAARRLRTLARTNAWRHPVAAALVLGRVNDLERATASKAKGTDSTLDNRALPGP